MFETYPDVVNIEQIMNMLKLGKSKVYELLRNNIIRHVKIGSKYIVPKQAVIDLFNDIWYSDSQMIDGRQPNLVMKGDYVC